MRLVAAIPVDTDESCSLPRTSTIKLKDTRTRQKKASNKHPTHAIDPPKQKNQPKRKRSCDDDPLMTSDLLQSKNKKSRRGLEGREAGERPRKDVGVVDEGGSGITGVLHAIRR